MVHASRRLPSERRSKTSHNLLSLCWQGGWAIVSPSTGVPHERYTRYAPPTVLPHDPAAESQAPSGIARCDQAGIRTPGREGSEVGCQSVDHVVIDRTGRGSCALRMGVNHTDSESVLFERERRSKKVGLAKHHVLH